MFCGSRSLKIDVMMEESFLIDRECDVQYSQSSIQYQYYRGKARLKID